MASPFIFIHIEGGMYDVSDRATGEALGLTMRIDHNQWAGWPDWDISDEPTVFGDTRADVARGLRPTECAACHTRWPTMIMIDDAAFTRAVEHHKLDDEVEPRDRILCIPCMEAGIGHKITATDLRNIRISGMLRKTIPINEDWLRHGYNKILEG